MKYIICSHGFGVRADSRGMFLDIEKAFPDCNFRMFDYNEVKENGDTVVRPLEEQAKLLQAQIDAVPDGEIVLLCHSQGSMIAGLVDLSRVSKVILLAPPVRTGIRKAMKRMRLRIGSVYSPEGMSKLSRKDGTNTFIPKEYLESMDKNDQLELYQKVADAKPTVIVRCLNDEVIGLTNVNEVKNAEHIDLAADHNFTGIFRERMIETLENIL